MILFVSRHTGKMSTLVHLVFLASITSCFGSPPNFLDFEAYKPKMCELFKNTVFANLTQDQVNKIRLDKTLTCFEVKNNESPIFVTPREEFIDNARKCVNDFMKELDNKLPEKSKDALQFTADLVLAFYGFLYDYKDVLFSDEFGAYMDECSEENEDKLEFDECVQQIVKPTFDVETSCQKWTKIQKCVENQFDKYCPLDDYSQMRRSFFAITKKCRQIHDSSSDFGTSNTNF